MPILSEIKNILDNNFQYFTVIISAIISLQLLKKGKMSPSSVKRKARIIGLAIVMSFAFFIAIIEYNLNFYSRVMIPYFQRSYMWQKNIDIFLNPIERYMSKYILIIVSFVALLLIIDLFRLMLHYLQGKEGDFDFTLLVLTTYMLFEYFLDSNLADQTMYILQYCCMLSFTGFLIFSFTNFLAIKYLKAYDS